MAKSVILPSLKDNFFILQCPHLGPLEATTSIRPPRSFEAATSNRPVRPRFRGTSEVTWGQKSKKCYFANFDGWTQGVWVEGERQGLWREKRASRQQASQVAGAVPDCESTYKGRSKLAPIIRCMWLEHYLFLLPIGTIDFDWGLSSTAEAKENCRPSTCHRPPTPWKFQDGKNFWSITEIQTWNHFFNHESKHVKTLS